MLRVALNALTAIHSRPAFLKRPLSSGGDMYTPCRITPSNYSRFLSGPEYVTIQGVEFIIPIDSMLGQFSHQIGFDRVPALGNFKIKYGVNQTADLPYSISASDLQTALRLLPGKSNVIVTGDFTSGFNIVYPGVFAQETIGEIIDNTLFAGGTSVLTQFSQDNTPWDLLIKKGDRIIDGNRLWSVDQITDMHDIGAQVMAFRVGVN